MLGQEDLKNVEPESWRGVRKCGKIGVHRCSRERQCDSVSHPRAITELLIDNLFTSSRSPLLRLPQIKHVRMCYSEFF